MHRYLQYSLIKYGGKDSTVASRVWKTEQIIARCSKSQSIVQSIVQSRVQGPGFVATHFMSNIIASAHINTFLIREKGWPFISKHWTG